MKISDDRIIPIGHCVYEMVKDDMFQCLNCKKIISSNDVIFGIKLKDWQRGETALSPYCRHCSELDESRN